ncbi:hypothetical protein HK102_001838 [Quaeritorhiza haematococci]|nr:hypothetical protein HK102_001838 [Quaeritorhiza haematococci]
MEEQFHATNSGPRNPRPLPSSSSASTFSPFFPPDVLPDTKVIHVSDARDLDDYEPDVHDNDDEAIDDPTISIMHRNSTGGHRHQHRRHKHRRHGVGGSAGGVWGGPICSRITSVLLVIGILALVVILIAQPKVRLSVGGSRRVMETTVSLQVVYSQALRAQGDNKFSYAKLHQQGAPSGDEEEEPRFDPPHFELVIGIRTDLDDANFVRRRELRDAFRQLPSTYITCENGKESRRDLKTNLGSSSRFRWRRQDGEEEKEKRPETSEQRQPEQKGGSVAPPPVGVPETQTNVAASNGTRGNLPVPSAFPSVAEEPPSSVPSGPVHLPFTYVFYVPSNLAKGLGPEQVRRLKEEREKYNDILFIDTKDYANRDYASTVTVMRWLNNMADFTFNWYVLMNEELPFCSVGTLKHEG